MSDLRDGLNIYSLQNTLKCTVITFKQTKSRFVYLKFKWSVIVIVILLFELRYVNK